MTRWLVIVESKCTDPACEDQFNQWYDEIHLSDVLETPGVVRATRYERVGPSEEQAKYLAAYEIEADDLGTVMAAIDETVKQKAAQGRMSPIIQLAAVSSFRQISARSGKDGAGL